MIVELNEPVVGKDGELGKIQGLSIDPKSQAAEQMVIKHGLPNHPGHLAVLGLVKESDPGVVRVDLNEEELEDMELYDPDAYSSTEADRGGTFPTTEQGYGSFERQGATITHHDTRIVPQDERPTIVSRDTPVWDVDGEKVGEIENFAVETTTGAPTRICISRGLFNQARLDIPVEWVAEFGVKGIALKVGRQQVQALARTKD